KSAPPYTKRLWHEEEVSVLFDLANCVVDQIYGFVDLSDCEETLRKHNVELRVAHLVVHCVAVFQAILKSFYSVSCIAAANGRGAFVTKSDMQIGPQRVGLGVCHQPVCMLFGVCEIAGPDEYVR